MRRTSWLTPVTSGYIQTVFGRLGITAEDLRVDRLLAEVQATGGDPLKLALLFALSDPTAIRYCAELDPLDQDTPVSLRRDTVWVAGAPKTV